MALARTTLSAAITANQLTFGVVSTAVGGFPPVGAAPLSYQPLVIDDEVMFLVSVPATNVVTVRMRGSDGTEATVHDLGSSVVTSATPIDFPLLQPGMITLRAPSDPDIVTYGQSGAILVPIEAITIAFLAGSAALAMTLGAPSLALNGIVLKVSSQSAFAHVVTATGLYDTGGSASPYTTATFPAFAGASMELIAQNGLWNVNNSSPSPVVFS